MQYAKKTYILVLKIAIHNALARKLMRFHIARKNHGYNLTLKNVKTWYTIKIGKNVQSVQQ